MDTVVTQEKVAGWANSIADLSEKLAHQITSHTKDERDLESILLYLKLIRHSTLMRDVSRLILANPKQRLANAFILLRCMLEDFITIYFLKVNKYDQRLIIRYVAEGIHNRIRMMEETAALNNKFYKGSLEGLIPFNYVQNEKNRIRSNPDNDPLFTNKKQFKLKRFPSAREIIDLLPVDDSAMANVPSILSWIQYSEYVHHSVVSARGDANPQFNDLQIRQLKSTMLYAFKLFEFAKERLIEREFPLQLESYDKLREELTANTINSEDLWEDLYTK